MTHIFDVEIAENYGLNEAILFQNIGYWCWHNETNGKEQHEGRCWTYNSVKAFKEQFPYLTENAIRNALKHLEEQGMILTGNFNENAYDRTMWYALSDYGKTIFGKQQMHLQKTENGNVENCKSLYTDNKPNKKPNNNKRFVPPTLEEVKEYVRERNSNVNPDKFFQYYEAGHWYDKAGDPVKNWKQRLISWEGRNKSVQAQGRKKICQDDDEWSNDIDMRSFIK